MAEGERTVGLVNPVSPGRIFDNKPGSILTGKSVTTSTAGASSQIPSSHKSPKCPNCGAKKVWRNGHRSSLYNPDIQRWVCRDCGNRFSDPDDVSHSKIALQQAERIESMKLKSAVTIQFNRQICVAETKNLVSESQIVDPKTLDIKPLSVQQRQNLNGAILEFMWDLQKNQNAAEDTYMPYGENLKFLVKNNADLYNPDSVKHVLKVLKKTDIRKYNLMKAYKSFMKYAKITAEMPVYKYKGTLPFIPLETEIDQLIAGCANLSRQMSIFLQLLKETGARTGEAYGLTWGDIDEVAKTISITPEKGSNPRLNKISEKLLLLLCSLKGSAVPSSKEKVFIWKRKFYIGKSFRIARARIVANTGNRRLLKIHFHTLRYWRGTQVYIKTKSLAHVMVQLGHRSFSSAELYVNLAEATAEVNDGWITAVATTLDEARKLLEAGFEYVHDWENSKIYRKAK